MRRQFVLLALISLLSAAPALAQKRVALAVGNSAYKAAGFLANPINDATLVADALRQVHFQTIEIKSDLGIAEFRQSLRRFQAQADGAEVALIYFAGHGVEAGGTNWLIPIDAELAEVRDLEYEAIKVDLLLSALSGARMRVLVLDACRNNPYGRQWRSGTRNVNQGLKGQEADDVLVLFAAAPGQTASDGTDNHSPFATAFAKRLPEAGLPIQLLGGRVRDDVLRATGGVQRPYVSASITGEPFYLMPGQSLVRPPEAPAQPAAPPQPPAAPAVGEAERIWETIKDSRDVAVFEAFGRRYANTFHGDLAKARAATLKEGAEAERQALFKKKEEERGRAEAEAKERERFAIVSPPPPPPAPPPPANPSRVFDGHWYSPEWKYGYRLRDGVGIATSTNSPRFKVGDIIIRIRAVGAMSFEGEQVYRDGQWYRIKGTLRSDGRIYIDGEKNVSWFMNRTD